MTTATATKTYDVTIYSKQAIWECVREDEYLPYNITRELTVTTDNLDNWLADYNRNDHTTHPDIFGEIVWELGLVLDHDRPRHNEF
jgi:hypothetical protein